MATDEEQDDGLESVVSQRSVTDELTDFAATQQAAGGSTFNTRRASYDIEGYESDHRAARGRDRVYAQLAIEADRAVDQGRNAYYTKQILRDVADGNISPEQAYAAGQLAVTADRNRAAGRSSYNSRQALKALTAGQQSANPSGIVFNPFVDQHAPVGSQGSNAQLAEQGIGQYPGEEGRRRGPMSREERAFIADARKQVNNLTKEYMKRGSNMPLSEYQRLKSTVIASVGLTQSEFMDPQLLTLVNAEEEDRNLMKSNAIKRKQQALGDKWQEEYADYAKFDATGASIDWSALDAKLENERKTASAIKTEDFNARAKAFSATHGARPQLKDFPGIGSQPDRQAYQKAVAEWDRAYDAMFPENAYARDITATPDLAPSTEGAAEGGAAPARSRLAEGGTESDLRETIARRWNAAKTKFGSNFHGMLSVEQVNKMVESGRNLSGHYYLNPITGDLQDFPRSK